MNKNKNSVANTRSNRSYVCEWVSLPETNCVKRKINDETFSVLSPLSCETRTHHEYSVLVSFSWLMTFPLLLLLQFSVVCAIWFFVLNSTKRFFFSRCIVIFRCWHFYRSPSSTVSACLVHFFSHSLAVFWSSLPSVRIECGGTCMSVVVFQKAKKKIEKLKYFWIVRTYLISIVIVIN